MKKDVTEPRTFCDFCPEPSHTQCMVCGKDLCSKHRVELVIYLNYGSEAFRVSLCREDAQPLLPFLEGLIGLCSDWQKAGQNPEYNEARLRELIVFLMAHTGATSGTAEV